MRNISFTERAKLEKEDLIVVYRGIDDSGQSLFAFVLCNAQGISKMRADCEERQTSSLGVYGKVLYLDYLAEPDEAAEQYLCDFVKNYKLLKDLI